MPPGDKPPTDLGDVLEKRFGLDRRQLERAHWAVDFNDRLKAARRDNEWIDAVRLARLLAIAGLPKKPIDERDFSRTLRLGTNPERWCRVRYSTEPGKRLPYGGDRFVLVGVQELALQQDSPIVTFDRAGELLKLFGLDEGGAGYRRLRERLSRIAGLSITLKFGPTRESLDDPGEHHDELGDQVFVFRRYWLPSREKVRKDRAREARERSQATLPFPTPREPSRPPYGVQLSDDFWKHLQETKQRLIVPLELLRRYIDKPLAWDYACFLLFRCGSAKRPHIIPHETLMELFKDGPRDRDPDVIRRLQAIHKELIAALGDVVKARIIEVEPKPNPKGGRPRKQWALTIEPMPGQLLPWRAAELPKGGSQGAR